jgi:CheY-like chemotaxis protein
VEPSALILVVDDDRDIREALCILLSAEGYRAVSAANGEEALSYLSSRELPSLILLDLMMPIMDGWEFRRRQKHDARLSDIPVVAITAAGNQTERSIPVDRVLPKPLELDHVLQALHDYC